MISHDPVMGSNPQFSDDKISKNNRIKTACVSCRQRKCKCDGLSPCSNCVNHNVPCVYPELQEKRKRGKGKKNSKAEIHSINRRLQSLESLIGRLADQLENRNGNAIDKVRNRVPSVSSNDSWKSDDFDSDKSNTSPSISASSVNSADNLNNAKLNTSPSTDTSSLKNYLNQLRGESCSAPSRTISPTGDALKESSFQSTSQQSSQSSYHQSFGINTVYSMFSKDSLTWLRHKSKSENLIIPIKNLPIILDGIIKSSTDAWVNPPSKPVILSTGNSGYFPSNPQLVFEILDAYYLKHYFQFFVDLELLKNLFTMYYVHNNNPKLGNNGSFKFKYSELILMNTALALCLSTRDGTDEIKSNYKTLSGLSEDDFHNLKEDFFNNAICYYGRISAISEGIKTIQGLVLMIMYVEYHYASDFHLVFMISSVMIRHAQELGIHKLGHGQQGKLNNNLNLSDLEQELCRRLWWFCEIIDMTTSYRTGKSPLIRTEDMCSFSGEPIDENKVPCWVSGSPNDMNPNTLNNGIVSDSNSNDFVKFILSSCQYRGIHFYHWYFLLLLTRIQRKSYNLIFSPNAQVEINDQDLYFERIDSINHNMRVMAKAMDPGLRPELLLPEFEFDDAGNETLSLLSKQMDSNQVFLLKLNFMSHYMLVNRSVLYQTESKKCTDFPTSPGEKFMYHVDLAAMTARSILKMAQKVDTTKVSRLFLGWGSFHVFEAFSNLLANCLCMIDTSNNAYSKEANQLADDAKLLIELALNFFCYSKSLNGCNNWIEAFRIEPKLAIYDLIVRIFLELLLKFLSDRLGIRFPEYNLEEHFNSVKLVFPQLFKDDIEQVKLFKSILKDSYNASDFKRIEPSLANIINTTNYDPITGFESNTNLPVNETGYAGPDQEEDYFAALLYSQTFNLPNFFYDV